jgi:hypothetical protein
MSITPEIQLYAEMVVWVIVFGAITLAVTYLMSKIIEALNNSVPKDLAEKITAVVEEGAKQGKLFAANRALDMAEETATTLDEQAIMSALAFIDPRIKIIKVNGDLQAVIEDDEA